jgi:hypothetical protein
MTATHTPGPWRAEQAYAQTWTIVRRPGHADDPDLRQTVQGIAMVHGPASAWDAALMAAAPEMLRVLLFVQKLQRMRAAKGEPDPAQAVSMVDQVVDQARGLT